MVTLYDVAQRAGVSIATVSRVLHGHETVRERTRARVRAAIDELGYVPDGAAQSLATSRKDVIGLVGVERAGVDPRQYDSEAMSMLFYDGVLRGVESRLREAPWSLLLTYLREEEALGVSLPDGEPVASKLLALSGKVDGLLIGEGVAPPSVMARLARRLPVVAVAGDPDLRGVDVISADNWSGAQDLVEHLITEHGARRLLYVDGPPGAPDAVIRREAIAAIVDAYPGVAVTGRFEGHFTFHGGEAAAGPLLEQARRDGGLPDAVLCANDSTAIGLLHALARQGVQVPRDIAVVGFDDIFPASLSDPPLTTVHQPFRDLGERACDRLIQRIANPSLRGRVELIPSELVLRSSCGCPPGTSERRPVARRRRGPGAGANAASSRPPPPRGRGAWSTRAPPAGAVSDGRGKNRVDAGTEPSALARSGAVGLRSIPQNGAYRAFPASFWCVQHDPGRFRGLRAA
ncbi:MAG TPA: LacI family DNA-binding transcriptional regulator [Trebonia sp.]